MEHNRCVCCGAIVPEGWQVCPVCNRIGKVADREKPRTNGDRIRDMSNRELAQFLSRYTKTSHTVWLRYLNQEVDPI